jgi:peptidyl-prolyl cis-trans isomerase SurA
MKPTSDLFFVLWRTLACALVSVAVFAPAAFPVELDRIIAVVNDDVIMKSELEERLRTVEGQLQEQGTPVPPRSILEKQVLDRLILTKLQVQMASETGIRVDDETLNRTISNIAAENQVSLEEFRKILEQDGYSYEKFREDIRGEILISRLRQRQVDNRVTVTEREVDNFLATQQHQAEAETEYHLRHILIALPDSPSARQLQETQELAQKVWNDLKAGGDFAQLAATYSDGPQALDGGDLGWRKAGQVPTLFADFVAGMQKGDISELIRSPGGFHIIKLDDVRDSQKVVVTQTHSRHILIRTDELVKTEDARQRLEQLRLRIEGGDDFAEVAKGNSHDSVSAAEGGDLGWTSPGDLDPDFEQVMNSLKLGEVSQPFQTQYGWHIVQVLERREHDSTEDVKRARAREAIRARKLDEARDIWLREMRDEAYVEYRLDS